MLPNKLDFAWSMLSAIQEGRYCRDKIVEKIDIELGFGHPASRRSIYDKISSLLTLLKRNGLVTNETRGVWSTTPLGEFVLGEGKSSSALDFLQEPGLFSVSDLEEASLKHTALMEMVVIPLGRSNRKIRYERELQHLIMKKIKHIVINGEPLTLYKTKGGKSPMEYRTRDRKRIDILATGKKSRRLVCIELKLNEGSDSHLGRLQAYMGRMMESFPMKEVTGVLLARRITPAAKYSSLVAKDKIVLMEYEIIEDQGYSKLVIKRIKYSPPIEFCKSKNIL